MATVTNGLPPQPRPMADLDSHLLSALRWSAQKGATLCDLSHEFNTNAGRVLGTSLPYESTPPLSRRLMFDESDSSEGQGIVMVAHCISPKNNFDHRKAKVKLSSGFVIGEGLIVTCAHTFEEARRSLSLSHVDEVLSGSFVISGRVGSRRGYDAYPVKSIPSCIPRSDVLLLEVLQSGVEPDPPKLVSLPVSPYPVHKDTKVRAHFVADGQTPPLSLGRHGWSSWMGTAGVYKTWAKCTVRGYRDFTGKETHPGTYDALSHMMFTPLPTSGSSGGPIVGEDTGAVVGMVLGSHMDGSRVDGVRGWGVPAEVIFEMFTLPGLEGKK